VGLRRKAGGFGAGKGEGREGRALSSKGTGMGVSWVEDVKGCLGRFGNGENTEKEITKFKEGMEGGSMEKLQVPGHQKNKNNCGMRKRERIRKNKDHQDASHHHQELNRHPR